MSRKSFLMAQDNNLLWLFKNWSRILWRASTIPQPNDLSDCAISLYKPSTLMFSFPIGKVYPSGTGKSSFSIQSKPTPTYRFLLALGWIFSSQWAAWKDWPNVQLVVKNIQGTIEISLTGRENPKRLIKILPYKRLSPYLDLCTRQIEANKWKR